MIQLRTFFKKFTQTRPIILGRWNRSSETQTHKKIDWANEDHCGTCSSIETLPENDPIRKSYTYLEAFKSKSESKYGQKPNGTSS